MKNTFYLLILSCTFFSCTKEDKCSASQFLGDWTGSSTCIIGGNKTMETVNISISGGGLVLNGAIFKASLVERDDCSLKGGVKLLGIGEEISGSLSEDGTSLTLTYKVVPAGENCTYTLKK
jgi:hypothetical protein